MKGAKGTDQVVRVGLAECRVGKAPMRITTLALGSCVGLVLYDRESKIGALAHVMLPRRGRVKNNTNMAKFVDSAIGMMVKRMIGIGARRNRITVKMFGGARMFDHVVGGNGVMQIGDENIEAARAECERLAIPIIAECVGGTKGRTICFDLDDGVVRVADAYGNEEMY